MGRPLKIDMAKPKTPRADGGFKKREPKPMSEKPDGCNTVFMGNLSYDIDDAAVTSFFEGCGEIANIRWCVSYPASCRIQILKVNATTG